MPMSTTAAIGMNIHLGNGLGGAADFAAGSSTFTTGPSVKSSSGLVAEATSRRKLYLSAAAPVAGVVAGDEVPAGFVAPAGGAVTGASNVTTNCWVPPGAKSRSDSPDICSHSCLALSKALTRAMPRTGRGLVLVTVNTASACPLASVFRVSVAVVVIAKVLGI